MYLIEMWNVLNNDPLLVIPLFSPLLFIYFSCLFSFRVLSTFLLWCQYFKYPGLSVDYVRHFFQTFDTPLRQICLFPSYPSFQSFVRQPQSLLLRLSAVHNLRMTPKNEIYSP